MLYKSAKELLNSPTGVFLNNDLTINLEGIDSNTLAYYFGNAKLWDTMTPELFETFVLLNPYYRLTLALNLVQSPVTDKYIIQYLNDPSSFLEELDAIYNASEEEGREGRSAYANTFGAIFVLRTIPYLHLMNMISAEDAKEIIEQATPESVKVPEYEEAFKSIDRFLTEATERDAELDNHMYMSFFFEYAYPHDAEKAAELIERLNNATPHLFAEHYDENSASVIAPAKLQTKESGLEPRDFKSTLSSLIDVSNESTLEFYEKTYTHFEPTQVFQRLSQLESLTKETFVRLLPILVDEYLHAFIHGSEPTSETLQSIVQEVNKREGFEGVLSLFIHHLFELLDGAEELENPDTGETFISLLGNQIQEDEFYGFVNRVLRRATLMAVSDLTLDELQEEMEIFSSVIPMEMLIIRGNELKMSSLSPEHQALAKEVIRTIVSGEEGPTNEKIDAYGSLLAEMGVIIAEEDNEVFNVVMSDTLDSAK